MDYDNGSKGLDVYFWNGARTRSDLYSPANLLLANTWYCAEVEANETSTGTGQVWLNGTSVGTVNVDLSVTNPISKLYLWNNAAVGTVSMDDVEPVLQLFGVLLGLRTALKERLPFRRPRP